MGVDAELRRRMEAIAARFPNRLSALVPMLYLVQEACGYVSKEGMELAAEVLATTPAYIDSVASFYTMLYREPVGKYVLQVCKTLPCALMGAAEVISSLEEQLQGVSVARWLRGRREGDHRVPSRRSHRAGQEIWIARTWGRRVSDGDEVEFRPEEYSQTDLLGLQCR